MDELVNTFRNYVPDFNLDEASQSEKYLDIFMILKSIQEFAISTPPERNQIEFDFRNFVETCIEKTELGDIELIIKHLSDTLELLSKMEKPDEGKDLYYQIRILNKVSNQIQTFQS